MNKFSDQMLAQRMLETRERGYSFALFVRRNTARYTFLVSYFAIGLGVLAWLQAWPFFYVLLGLFAGCVFRDIGWFRAIGRTWAFSLKVTDWDKVQKLADEKNLV
jgi:hypothetical protein